MLYELFFNIDYQCLQGNMNQSIEDICYDSRQVKRHCLFVCLQGWKDDGHCYIDEAIAKGASVIVIEKEVVMHDHITYILVKDSRLALALLSDAFFDYPSSKLKVIGITGTKGKTTVAYMIASILEAAGEHVGMIGTIGCFIGGKKYQSVNTTPESYEIQKMMAIMIEQNCTYCIMEVSSQGLKYHRVDGIQFDYAIYTNLSIDHIGTYEHPTFEDYKTSKQKLFQMTPFSIVNQDDPYYSQMLSQHYLTYSLHQQSHLQASHIQYIQNQFLSVQFQTQGLFQDTFLINIPGQFNVYNALAAITFASHLHIPLLTIQYALSHLCIPGRTEMISHPSYTVMIDYAHNAYSYAHLFETLNHYKHCRLICVYGAGGKRDHHRRYEVGKVVAQNHAFSILTADNPRGEKVSEICSDIIRGIESEQGKYIVIEDRKQAIFYALKQAQKGDFVLCLGKGHEDYQIMKEKRLPFSEKKIIENYFMNND